MALYLNLQATRASLERVFFLLDQKPEVVERPDATALDHAPGRHCLQLRRLELRP